MREPAGTVELRRALSERGIELYVLEPGRTCSIVHGNYDTGFHECGKAARYNTCRLVPQGTGIWICHNRCDEHMERLVKVAKR